MYLRVFFTLFNIFFIIIVFGIRHFLGWKYTNSECEIAQKWIILLCFTEGLSALKVSFLLGAWRWNSVTILRTLYRVDTGITLCGGQRAYWAPWGCDRWHKQPWGHVVMAHMWHTQSVPSHDLADSPSPDTAAESGRVVSTVKYSTV